MASQFEPKSLIAVGGGRQGRRGPTPDGADMVPAEADGADRGPQGLVRADRADTGIAESLFH